MPHLSTRQPVEAQKRSHKPAAGPHMIERAPDKLRGGIHAATVRRVHYHAHGRRQNEIGREVVSPQPLHLGAVSPSALHLIGSALHRQHAQTSGRQRGSDDARASPRIDDKPTSGRERQVRDESAHSPGGRVVHVQRIADLNRRVHPTPTASQADRKAG